MLAEINLLPQKQQRNYTNLVVAVIILVIVLGATLTIITLSNQKNSELAKLEMEYQQVQQQTDVLQQQASEGNDASAVAELEKAVQWSKEYPIDFVPLLNELTKKLPDNGYFYELDYTDNSSLQLLVQFETTREVAFYLSRLKDSEILQVVKLTTVEAVQIEDEEEEDTVPRYLATYQLEIDRVALKTYAEEGNEE
ncbi:MAG: PilN domain-containing protein [Bacillota bacterium]